MTARRRRFLLIMASAALHLTAAGLAGGIPSAALPALTLDLLSAGGAGEGAGSAGRATGLAPYGARPRIAPSRPEPAPTSTEGSAPASGAGEPDHAVRPPPADAGHPGFPSPPHAPATPVAPMPVEIRMVPATGSEPSSVESRPGQHSSTPDAGLAPGDQSGRAAAGQDALVGRVATAPGGPDGARPAASGERALAAPGQGTSPLPAEYGPYLARFRERIQGSLVYPLSARRRGLHGTVELDMLVDPSGRVSRIEVVSSSSHAMLDEAAVDSVKRLDPLPLPGDLPARPIRVRLPLTFELR